MFILSGSFTMARGVGFYFFESDLFEVVVHMSGVKWALWSGRGKDIRACVYLCE